MTEIEFILYVANQEKSRDFYSNLLGFLPILDVPGMTEFSLSPNVKLGLMPEKGIAKILNDKMPDPSLGNGLPRCELYLKVKDASVYEARSIQLRALQISPLMKRDWGDRVVYFSDPDGHVLAFADNL